MSNLAIKAENVSKLYRLGDVGTGTLSNDLTRFWARLRGKEDPFSSVAASNDRTKKSSSDYVWSLRKIDFEIQKGDAVGIIGRNGAGKSTLLKVLSRITSPTTGRIRVDGRIASLLEVGTGFSPELTGRQNIFMNGAIMGMTRSEITSKLDEIVDFSGCEAYIDTPVKRYSSGMYVRLAFAVAAHLDPEILIVDEVLAVGDADFQNKCMGKMQDVNRLEGRTVLFVSHNLASIQALTKKCIFLKNGELIKIGKTEDVTPLYLSAHSSTDKVHDIETKDGNVSVDKFEFIPAVVSGFNSTVKFELFLNISNSITNLNYSIGVCNNLGTRLFTMKGIIPNLKNGINKRVIYPDNNFLPPGDYVVSLYLGIMDNLIFYNDSILSIQISEENVNETFLVSGRNKLGLYFPANIESI